MDPEAAYSDWLDAATTISCLAYEIADLQNEIAEMHLRMEAAEGQAVQEQEQKEGAIAAAIKQKEADLAILIKKYQEECLPWMQRAEEARVTAGPTQKEQEEDARLEMEEQMFDVAESCADW